SSRETAGKTPGRLWAPRHLLARRAALRRRALAVDSLWCRRRAVHTGSGHEALVAVATDLPVDQARAESDVPLDRNQAPVDLRLAAADPAATAGEGDLLPGANHVVQHLALQHVRTDLDLALDLEGPGDHEHELRRLVGRPIQGDELVVAHVDVGHADHVQTR